MGCRAHAATKTHKTIQTRARPDGAGRFRRFGPRGARCRRRSPGLRAPARGGCGRACRRARLDHPRNSASVHGCLLRPGTRVEDVDRRQAAPVCRGNSHAADRSPTLREGRLSPRPRMRCDTRQCSLPSGQQLTGGDAGRRDRVGRPLACLTALESQSLGVVGAPGQRTVSLAEPTLLWPFPAASTA